MVIHNGLRQIQSYTMSIHPEMSITNAETDAKSADADNDAMISSFFVSSSQPVRKFIHEI